MPSKDIVSLSKCCFTLLLFFSITNYTFGQNVITVKKKDSVKTEPTVNAENDFIEIKLEGFYYSEPFTTSKGVPGQPPTDYKRMIICIDSYNRVYIFHSTKPIKKLYEKFSKTPSKLTEEYGSIELTSYGDLFIDTKEVYSERIVSGYNTFKYKGSIISRTELYLEYKASFQSKSALNLYLNKY